MKTRLLMIIGIVTVTGIAISLAYYTTDSTMTSKTKQECDMGIHREQYSLDFGNATYRNQYVIKNGCVDGISHNEDMNSLVINFYKTKNGMIQIILPEFLYDLRPKSDHVVLADGVEIAFEQLAPSVLLINFTENTTTIKIIDATITSEPKSEAEKQENNDSVSSLPFGMMLENIENMIQVEPIYRNNPDNSGELILDIDAMQQVQKILNKCNYTQKLESGEIPEQNSDGSYNAVTSSLRFYNNGTHYIDTSICKWIDSFETVTYNCFDAKPSEQNWYFGPVFFDNGTHHLNAQKCQWITFSEDYSDLPLCDSNPERNFDKCRELP